MKILQLQDVSVTIDDKSLLQNISFQIEKGSITALLGHNGAGKSTLMKAIMHVIEINNGTIQMMEQYNQTADLLEFKKQLAYLPEEPMLMPELTVMQHFQLYGRSYQMTQTMLEKKVEQLTEAFEIAHKVHEYPEALSKGMRQKVQTICALLPDVPLLLIDEPFMGLDIYAIDYLKQLIKTRAKSGTSMLLTTHQLETAKELADNFILLDHGNIVKAGAISEFDSITRGTPYD